ncbi:MAG: PAS domain S-box protein [Chitinophagales bacterium]
MYNTNELNRDLTTLLTDFELFFRRSVDPMLIAALDGTILDFNTAYETATGFSREELFERAGGWGIIHPDDIPAAQERVIELRTHGYILSNFTVRMTHKDGSELIFSFDASADLAKGYIYVIGRDVTSAHKQQQELQESEFHLKFFFDNSDEGMCILRDGKFQMVNKALLKMFGYSDEKEMLNRHYLEFVDPELHSFVDDIVRRNVNEAYRSRVVRKDGTLRNVEVKGKTISYDHQQLRISVLRDLDEPQKVLNKIRENEERFKAIFQNSTFGILLTDTEGNIMEVNNILVDRLGFERSDMLRMTMLDIIYPEDKARTKIYLKDLIEKKVSRTYTERRLLKKNGTATWSKITSNLLENISDRDLVMSVVEDIEFQKSNEQALIESEEKFRAVFESSPMGIMITRKPGVIVDVNTAVADMMGYSEHELKGMSVIDLTHPDDLETTIENNMKLYSGGIQHYSTEKRYIRKDGRAFWAKTVVSFMHVVNDEVITVAVVENIDRRKKTEQTLEQKNKELTHINQELEHFAYVASHDLQEPLRTITSFIQILDKRYGDQLDEDGQQFMGFVVEGAKRMQTLIHDLLEYSRINRFNNAFEKIDLNEIFDTVNRVLKDKIESNDALVMSENLPTVYGSKLQLTQVFQNLIDNAIKFRGKKKPEIIISLNDMHDKWELVFRDNGIGISPEYYQRIFVIFQRLHTLEEYTGTGIGLAVCKKIIERHGGEIWVESKPGKGSAFHISIAKNLMAPVS